jgi:excisionase family DNA binding protein
MDGMDMLSVREFTESFGGRLSSGAIYRAIADGRLPHIRMGRRLFIPVTALDRMLELCPVLDEKLVEEVDMIRGNSFRENSHGVERVEEKKGLFGRWFG